MRFRHSISLAVRALLAVGLLSVALLAVIFTVAALPTALILEVLGDSGAATTTELNRAVLIGTAIALVIAGPGVAWTLVRGVHRERQALLTNSRPASSENGEDAVSAACRRLSALFDVRSQVSASGQQRPRLRTPPAARRIRWSLSAAASRRSS